MRYRRLIISFLFLLILFGGFFAAKEVFGIEVPTNITGWSWIGVDTNSDNEPVIGYVSLNCVNGGEEQCNTSPYGIHIEYETGNIEGYAWNDQIGWIDFDPQVYPSTENSEGGVTNSPVFLHDNTRALKGWAQRESEITSDSGWIQFDHSNSSPVYVDDSGYIHGRALYTGSLGTGYIFFDDSCGDRVHINSVNRIEGCAVSTVLGNIDFSTGDVLVHPESGDLRGYVYQGVSESDRILFDPNPFETYPNHTVHFIKTPSEADWYNESFDSTERSYGARDVTGWARIVSIYEEGLRYGYDDWGYVKFHRTQDTVSSIDYGVQITDTTLQGYAWSSGGGTSLLPDENIGVGWIQFDPSRSTSVFHPPWVEFEDGDIFSQEGFGSESTYDPPVGKDNAMYLILSNGNVMHFTSSLSDFPSTYTNIPNAIDLPVKSSLYTNLLTSLDIEGLSRIVHGSENVYGNTVHVYNGDYVWTENRFNDDVYIIREGDLTISSSVVFQNASGPSESGRGTVIVDGNLYINADMDYEIGNISYLQNLSSSAWIVKGDIIIEESVNRTVGVMIALGKDGEGGGRFITRESNRRFEHTGALFASDFSFSRSYGIDLEQNRVSSENIVYDGRLLLNTPPGLEDISRSLPLIRSSAP